MTLELSQLNRIKQSLSRLLTTENIPARVCYRATKFSKRVADAIEELEEQRIKLVKKYGSLHGEALRVDPKNQEKFEAEFGALLTETIELPDISIALSDLEKANLSMIDYANLDFLITEDSTEKK